jgi:hypothetical protein
MRVGVPYAEQFFVFYACTEKKKTLRGFSPQANYTDRATAAVLKHTANNSLLYNFVRVGKQNVYHGNMIR